MSELAIKIRIADREYPMKVKPDEEERVRSAARNLNEKLKSYRDQFGIDDKQDLLAMVAFDYVVDSMRTEEAIENIDQSASEKIDYLNSLVSQAL